MAKKGELAAKICDHLAALLGRDRDNKGFSVVETGLKKMASEELDVLLLLVHKAVQPSKDAPPRKEANVPLHLVPADIDFVKNPKEMGAQLHMLPVISDRLIATFSNGDFPAMKRNVGIIERITLNVRKLTAQQLWDGINVYKGLPELEHSDGDDETSE